MVYDEDRRNAYDDRRGGYEDRRGGPYERRQTRGGGGGGYRRRENDRDYDRGYGGRRRRRSRSRSFSPRSNRDSFVRRRLDMSTSRERSRERERRRRKMQAECIRRAGGFKKLADSEGREPVRLFWDGFQWVAKTGASSALLSDPILVNSTRKLRRLYFGNLPLHLGLSETNFQQIVYQEMRKRGFCNDPDENPVLCVWFAKDKGNYGFVEFASVEETERALTMDGMECLGVPIKVSRPNDYCSATQQAQSLLQQPTGVTLPSGPLAQVLLNNPAMPAAVLPADFPDSTIVRLEGIVQPEDLEEGDTYQDIMDDIREGCESCGPIEHTLIITPLIHDAQPTWNAGDAYIVFGDPNAASECLRVMSDRKYFDRPIRATKVDGSLWVDALSTIDVGAPASRPGVIKAELRPEEEEESLSLNS